MKSSPAEVLDDLVMLGGGGHGCRVTPTGFDHPLIRGRNRAGPRQMAVCRGPMGWRGLHHPWRVGSM